VKKKAPARLSPAHRQTLRYLARAVKVMRQEADTLRTFTCADYPTLGRLVACHDRLRAAIAHLTTMGLGQTGSRKGKAVAGRGKA